MPSGPIEPSPTPTSDVIAGDSSTTALAVGQSFTGTGFACAAYNTILVTVYCDQPAQLIVDWSSDGVHYDGSAPAVTVTANAMKSQSTVVQNAYARTRLIMEGAINMTFLRLLTMLSSASAPEVDVNLTGADRVTILAQDGAVSMPLQATAAGRMLVSQVPLAAATDGVAISVQSGTGPMATKTAVMMSASGTGGVHTRDDDLITALTTRLPPLNVSGPYLLTEDLRIPPLGLAPAAASLPVVLATNHNNISVSSGQLPHAIGQLSSAQSLACVLASDQSALAVDSPQLPSTLGAKVSSGSLGVVLASDQAAIETTSAQLPAALGQTTMAASLPVTFASNQSALPVAIDGSVVVTSVAEDPWMNMARGLVPGVNVIRKGFTWPAHGAYNGYTVLDAPGSIHETSLGQGPTSPGGSTFGVAFVNSDSAQDYPAGTGCAYVTLVGVDAAGDAQSETLTMNGTGGVYSTLTFAYINDAVVDASTSSGPCGNITVSLPGTGSYTGYAAVGRIRASLYGFANETGGTYGSSCYFTPTGRKTFVTAVTGYSAAAYVAVWCNHNYTSSNLNTLAYCPRTMHALGTVTGQWSLPYDGKPLGPFPAGSVVYVAASMSGTVSFVPMEMTLVDCPA